MIRSISFYVLFLFFTISLFAQKPYDPELLAAIEAYGISVSEYVGGSFDPEKIFENSTWAATVNSPTHIGRPAAGVIGDYLYIFSSQNVAGQALAFHIPTKTWVNSTPSSVSGFNHAYTVAKNELYKITGSTFEKFSPAGDGTGTWSTLPTGPSTVNNAQNAMTYDGDNFIYAQSSGISSPYPRYMVRFNLTSNVWESVAAPLFPRRYAGMTAVGGKIYVVGGLLSDGTAANIAQMYDPGTDTWTQIASVPEDMNFTKWTLTNDGNYVYHVGSGGGYSSYPISNKVYYYNPNDNTWTLDSELPQERGLGLGLLLDGFAQLFFGGGNTGGSGTNFQTDCWLGTGGPYIPVELASFTAEVIGSSVHLNWSTITEQNNSHFVVEKSTDNSFFNEVGSLIGSGTTTEPQFYTFTDGNNSAGTYYYRLKQVDFDGSFEYTKTVEVLIGAPAEFSLQQNYPNPFNPSTTINYTVAEESIVSLKVYDLLGREIAELVNNELEAGNYTINFDASQLTSGIYFYTLQAGQFSETKKMTVLR